MDDREQAYWIEGENYPNDKYYFTGPGAGERFLQYLNDNDPCICGAQLLKPETVKKLQAAGEDELVPAEEII